ncbi:MAG TPA: hypothetical protein VHL80_10035 [Polyangia bacterium]|nr:hypothetical protein [Polyangia bacterium]
MRDPNGVVVLAAVTLLASCGGGAGGTGHAGAGGASGRDGGASGHDGGGAGAGAFGGGAGLDAAGGADAGGAGLDDAGGADAGEAGPDAAPDSDAGGDGGTSDLLLPPGDALTGDAAALDAAFQTFCASVRATMVSRQQTCHAYSHDQAVALVNVDPCAVWGSALAAGRMAFDATNAVACALALQGLDCERSSRPPACDGVLVGLVPHDYVGLGHPATLCDRHRNLTIEDGLAYPEPRQTLFSECAGGSVCTMAALASYCQTPGGAGSQCSLSLVSAPFMTCGTGYTCHAQSLAATSGTCIAVSAEGGPCSSSSDCAEGLYCSSGTCKTKHATGACAVADECVAPGTCDPGTGLCDSQKAMTFAGSLKLLSQTCSPAGVYATEANPSNCLVGVCSAAGACQLASASQSCAYNATESNATCGPNAFCEGGTCTDELY